MLPFICGIVEGFYGRPWSMEQRMVLFKWMQSWGLNVYMYGPKDDLKHRLLWRETYSAEESVQLKALVLGAQERGVEFVYAISPGQDITFSSSCDLALLKQKLRQVKGFGCMAFAILFDDIDHAMCTTDKGTFSSFAHAQTSVANEIYRYLGEPPVFLFCPTEYCSSLCYPSLSKSYYLKVIGDDLHPGIGVIWTGTSVVSKEITLESVQEIQDVIKRRPLIWDNLHANDYAQKRVFLGPYKGRPSDLVTKLHGMLLNPNCELEANYIPIHTLATWYRSGLGGKGDESCRPYCPNEALNLALADWVKEVNRPLCPSRQLLKEEVEGQLRGKLSNVVPQNGNIEPTAEKPCTSTTDLLPQCSPSKEGKAGDVPSRREQIHERPETGTAHRSVKEEAESGKTQPSRPGDSEKDSPLSAPEKRGAERVRAGDLDRTKPLSGPSAGKEGCGVTEPDGAEGDPERGEGEGRVSLTGRTLLLTGAMTLADLRLMADLFHLPYEHGEETAGLLRELHWLKTYSDFVSVSKVESKKAEEWRARSCAFQLACDRIVQLYRQFISSSNRAIVYDLYPYLWDIRNTLLVVKAFVMWLDGRIERDIFSFNSWMNCFQWCRTGSAPVVLGVAGGTWIHRGGLAGEFQMMLPVTNSSELFNQPPPLFPTLKSYTIRPFVHEDKKALYSVCRDIHNTKSQEKDAADIDTDLIGDRFLGHFLTLCPDYCFVLEDEEGACGCACGALEVRSFLKGCEAAWYPAMQEKYSKPTARDNLTPTQELMMFFRQKSSFPDSLLYRFPSLLQLNVHPQLLDSSEARNLVICLMSALKANVKWKGRETCANSETITLKIAGQPG
ncbi:protein O-GlcNAcase isoform X2 [Scyliorhinus canicula]|uniref:protein O-GlcNAcase isoform X2 n=1 Tax=Scyliorhinus canicula TaxID=7830 RepID=UPI0018F6B006|nr:protein O-GlcNAcase isoform X2 [Scyliorhinus canicula]